MRIIDAIIVVDAEVDANGKETKAAEIIKLDMIATKKNDDQLKMQIAVDNADKLKGLDSSSYEIRLENRFQAACITGACNPAPSAY